VTASALKLKWPGNRPAIFLTFELATGFKDSIAVGPVESAEDHQNVGLIADALVLQHSCLTVDPADIAF
jgi:hypothetical protein